MTADVTGTNLREPEQADWEGQDRKYAAPSIPVDEAGKPILFTGTLPAVITPGVTNEGYRDYLIDPIKLKDGTEIRFTRVSTKPFRNKAFNKAGQLLRAAGSKAAPQRTADYDAAIRGIAGRPVTFSADWSAYNKDNQERIDGYANFPLDPATGKRKSILKAGDTYTVSDRKGVILETKTVVSDVLFANLRVNFFEKPRG